MKMMKMPRVFQVNATQISDPCPDGPLENSVRSLALNYPQFRHTQVFEEDGEVVNDKVVYKLQLPPVKTNG